MASGHRIEIVATDGQRTVKLVWLHRQADDLYWGPCIQGFHGHGSYHESGQRHFRIGPDSKSSPPTENRWPRLSDFSGTGQVTSYGGSKDLSLIPWLPHENKKADEVVWIDTRAVEGDGLSINIMLLEPGRFDLLQGLQTVIPTSFYHVSTTVKPWIVVQVGPG